MGRMKTVRVMLAVRPRHFPGMCLALAGSLTLALPGCTPGQSYAVIAAITAPPFSTPPPEMQKLCDEHDGMKIYRTADNVAGYVDKTLRLEERDKGCGSIDTCQTPLKSGAYRFVEAAASREYIRQNPPQTKPYRSAGHLASLVDKPGQYRFTLEKLGHPNCRIFERWHAFTYPSLIAQGMRRSDFSDTCIATWPIEAFTAHYELRERHISRRRSYGWLTTFVKQVVDRGNASVMAEYRLHFIKFKKRDGTVNCSHDRETYMGWDVTKVLKPAIAQGQVSNRLGDAHAR